MLYPKLTNVKKSKEFIYILSILHIFLFIMLLAINYIFSRKFNWSIVVIISVLTIWKTVYNILDRNINLASYVFLQMIYLSILLLVIDYVFGFTKWSLIIGIPIVIMISNISMLIITFIKHKKYVKYALYEILILLFSIIFNITLCFLSRGITIMNVITFGISFTNFIFVIVLNARTLLLEFQKKFHI